MEVIEDADGYRIESGDDGPTLVVTDAWTDAAAHALDSGRADGLNLNYALGFKDTDLAFIRPWPLKRLAILARTVKDLTPVHRLSATLETMSIQSAPSATLDAGAFPELLSLGAAWGQVRSTLADAPQLEDLFLLSYDEADLSALRWNSSLRRLRFKDRPSMRSLSGVEALHHLRELEIYVAPLENLDPLRDVDSALEELHLESCRVGDLGPIEDLTTLRVLNASENGEIKSLRPLRKLGDLEAVLLFGSTKVSDDDLEPLASLPRLRELRMRSRRTYRPSVEQIQTLVAERGGM
jgi:Leucine-rich repeat (LRR) protein